MWVTKNKCYDLHHVIITEYKEQGPARGDGRGLGKPNKKTIFLVTTSSGAVFVNNFSS